MGAAHPIWGGPRAPSPLRSIPQGRPPVPKGCCSNVSARPPAPQPVCGRGRAAPSRRTRAALPYRPGSSGVGRSRRRAQRREGAARVTPRPVPAHTRRPSPSRALVPARAHDAAACAPRRSGPLCEHPPALPRCAVAASAAQLRLTFGSLTHTSRACMARKLAAGSRSRPRRWPRFRPAGGQARARSCPPAPCRPSRLRSSSSRRAAVASRASAPVGREHQHAEPLRPCSRLLATSLWSSRRRCSWPTRSSAAVPHLASTPSKDRFRVLARPSISVSLVLAHTGTSCTVPLCTSTGGNFHRVVVGDAHRRPLRTHFAPSGRDAPL